MLNVRLSMLELAVRFSAGGILLIAGPAKSRMGYAEVLKSVVGYKLLSLPVAKVWARLLPPVEVALGSALIAGLFISAVASLAAVLMLLITFAVAQAVIRNQKVACGCFKSGGKLISWPGPTPAVRQHPVRHRCGAFEGRHSTDEWSMAWKVLNW